MPLKKLAHMRKLYEAGVPVFDYLTVV